MKLKPFLLQTKVAILIAIGAVNSFAIETNHEQVMCFLEKLAHENPHALWEMPKYDDSQYSLTSLGLFQDAVHINTTYSKGVEKFKIIDFSFSSVRVIPNEIGLLRNLVMLNFTNSLINTLPSEIWTLGKLEELTLTSTQVSFFPPEIKNLRSLRKLHFSNTTISNLPPEIGKLSNLTSIMMFETQVEVLPIEMLFLNKLKTFCAINTPLYTKMLLIFERLRLRSSSDEDIEFLDKLEEMYCWNYFHVEIYCRHLNLINYEKEAS